MKFRSTRPTLFFCPYNRNSGDYPVSPLLDTILDHAPDSEYAVSEAITLIVGGFHTTGNFLSWALYYLALNPDVQEKVFAEIEAVLNRNGKEEVDENAVKNLKYV